jgi:hypothetical protein
MKKMKIYWIVILLIIISSCNKKYKNNEVFVDITDYQEILNDFIMDQNIKVENNTNNINNEAYNKIYQLIHDFPVTIEYNVDVNLARHYLNNIISNVNIIYKPESGVILNINEIENKNVNEILDNPILNIKIIYSPTTPSGYYFFYDIIDLLTQFEIFLYEEDIMNINSSKPYENIKISMENLNLYISRTFYTIMLFIIEYENNSNIYDYNIKIGTEKDKIIERFGEPHYYSEEENVYIYNSFATFRQLNITFENNIVTKVQIITFEGE